METASLFNSPDALENLNRQLPLAEKLRAIHEELRRRLPKVDRVAVALYDDKTDVLRTFIYSGDVNPLPHYESRLQDAPSLVEILRLRRPRIVNDLAIFARGTHTHTQRIAEHGYSSSYTLPVFLNERFVGFVFFNSYQRDAFQPDALRELDVFGHLIALLLTNELASIQTLAAAVQATRDIVSYRDTETAAHVDRVAHYAGLIARQIADQYGLDDETIERIASFARLHDVGKIAVPDQVLGKQGKLTADEVEVMKTHALKGRAIIDEMVRDFGLEGVHHVDLLKNIAEFHHEAMDGTGYPHGLQDGAIPLEARIVAVADVFDALTSQRCYKEAWSNPQAFAMLERLAGSKLDRDCVAALVQNPDAVAAIQQRFGVGKEQLPPVD